MNKREEPTTMTNRPNQITTDDAKWLPDGRTVQVTISRTEIQEIIEALAGRKPTAPIFGKVRAQLIRDLAPAGYEAGVSTVQHMIDEIEVPA